MKKSPEIILAFLCSCALTGLAQDVLVVSKSATQLIPISISGFTGEAEAVLKYDLSVLGLEVTTPDKAEYLISGTQNGRLEGRLQPAGPGSDGFARIYNGGNTRSEAHAFADDIVKAIRDAGLTVKVVIGGAPITPEFAREIGADGYAPDAASAVEAAMALLQGKA